MVSYVFTQDRNGKVGFCCIASLCFLIIGAGVFFGIFRKTRYIAEARIKSGRVDSKPLAELLMLNSLPESYMPPSDIVVLREKVRRRAFLARHRALVPEIGF